jgi:hypothetical protein
MTKSHIVRIDEHTYAKLRERAQQQHKPIGQIVSELVEAQETERFWREMREDCERLRTDSDGWSAYQAEVTLFEGGSMDGLEQEDSYYTPEEEAEIVEFAKSQSW